VEFCHKCRLVRRIFGPKREEVAGGWRRLHIEELHNLNTSPIITRFYNSMRMRWVGHAALMVGKMKERDHSEDLGVDGKIILKWMSEKSGGKVGTSDRLTIMNFRIP
jgi:hypothetical protein